MQMAIKDSARLQQEIHALLEEAAEALALAKTVGRAGALDLQRYAEQLKAEAEKLQAKNEKTGPIRRPRISGGWSIRGLIWSIITVAIIASLATRT